MSVSKIFNPSSEYKELLISIDGQVIHNIDLVHFYTYQRNYKFGLFADLKIVDTYDINNNGITNFNANTSIRVSITDFQNNNTIRTFRIMEMTADVHKENHKTILFRLVDEITYILSNTYISKGFNDTPVNALQAYFKELSIDTLITNDKMTLDIVDPGRTMNFVVPQHMSLLDFFVYTFNQENIQFYQSRSAIHIKEVVPSQLTLTTDSNGSVIEYSNRTIDYNYRYMIHDFQQHNHRLDHAMTYPVTETFRYSGDKAIISNTLNLQDVIADFSINKPLVSTDFQDGRGIKLDVQEIFTTNNQKNELFDKYMKYNEIDFVCPGDFTCQLMTIVKVSLRGNPVFDDSSLTGDVLNSGNYLITEIHECIISNKFVQKLILQRLK